MNITSGFIKKMIAKAICNFLKTHQGINMALNIQEMEIVTDEKNAHISIIADATMPKADINELVARI